MEFEQKAEEKKMSMSKNIARLAVTAGLTAALSFGGVMAPVTMAFAEGTTTLPNNSITITQNKDNAATTFKAYQIFKADVVDSTEAGATDKIVSNVNWADGVDADAQKAIIEAINDTALQDGASPEDVANWLTKNVLGTTKTTRVDKDSVLNKIAKVVKDKVTPTGNSFSAGTAFKPMNADNTSNTGYYLFLTDDTGIGQLTENKKNTGTSPIFAVVGGNPVVVAEKTSIPTVSKQILDDTKDKTADSASTDDWKNMGDAWIGQVIDYKLTGTVADNIASYDTYQYEFQDTLSKGLDVVKDANDNPLNLKVYIVKKDGTHAEVKYDASKGYTATATKDKNSKTELLKVSFADLKAIEDTNDASIAAGDIKNVVVTYQATLTSEAEYTTAGNTNEVKLVYSNDPMSNGTGTSESKKVADYVFGFDVTKIDPENPSANLLAGFTVKMIKEGPNKTVEKWLKRDGSFSNNANDAYTFETTGEHNTVSIPGLVAGTYLISESKTPAGYNTIADFEITVTPEFNADGTLKKLSVTPVSDMVTAKIEDGTTTTMIPVTIKNKKGSGLPLTGLNGVTFTWIAGGAVLCIGVAHLIRSRKQAEESEQE